MTKPGERAIAAIVIVGLALTAMAMMRSLKVRASNPAKVMTQQSGGGRKILDVEASAIDVIDQAHEPANSHDRMRLKAKNRRYDKPNKMGRRLTDLPSGGGAVGPGGEVPPTPIPVAQSVAIIIGTINKAQPYLTESESGMYTEFAVNVEEVFKNDGLPSLSPRSTVVVDREGGALRLQDGRVIRYESGGIGRLPRVGRRYVFFLKRVNDGQDISILTGYDLRQGHVFPLDGATQVFSPATGQITRKAPFEGIEETTFLGLVRTAISNPNRVLRSQGGSSGHN